MEIQVLTKIINFGGVGGSIWLDFWGCKFGKVWCVSGLDI